MFVVWVSSVEATVLRCSMEWLSCRKSQKLLESPAMRFACSFNENQTPSQVYLSSFGEIFNSVFLKNTTGWQLASALHSPGGK